MFLVQSLLVGNGTSVTCLRSSREPITAHGSEFLAMATVSSVIVCDYMETALCAIVCDPRSSACPRRSQEFRCLKGLLCGELAIQTLVLWPSKCHKKNNTQGGDKQFEAMHFK